MDFRGIEVLDLRLERMRKGSRLRSHGTGRHQAGAEPFPGGAGGGGPEGPRSLAKNGRREIVVSGSRPGGRALMWYSPVGCVACAVGEDSLGATEDKVVAA